jgi:hypothetical protein
VHPRGEAREPVRRRPGALRLEAQSLSNALPVERDDIAVALWGILVVATVLDLATTIYALEYLAAVEGNPFVRTLLGHAGYAGFVAAKLAVLGLGAALWRVLPRHQQLAVPAGLSLPTVLAVLVNATLFV